MAPRGRRQWVPSSSRSQGPQHEPDYWITCIFVGHANDGLTNEAEIRTPEHQTIAARFSFE
jgi:hypothetical protein